MLAILGSLCLYLHFRVSFSVSAKNPAWILIGIALHLSARLRMIYVLTILNRLVHGQFRSPLIFLAVFIQSCTKNIHQGHQWPLRFDTLLIFSSMSSSFFSLSFFSGLESCSCLHSIRPFFSKGVSL